MSISPQKKRILDLIYDEPATIGHWLGFKDLTRLHNEWLKQFLYGKEDMTLLAHRGSYKTTVLTLHNALHCIIKPNENIIMFRKTSHDVQEIMTQTAKILEAGALHQIGMTIYDGRDYSLLKSTSGEITTSYQSTTRGSPQIMGIGIGSSITGKHGDLIETDDIVNVADRLSKATREYTKVHYMELQNIKNRGGRFINTATPWHTEDAITLMPNVQKFDCYSTGLITDDEIEHLKKSMSHSLFSANYELKHVPDEDVIFPNPIMDGDPEKIINSKFSHIDAAYGGEDYTAFTICKKEKDKYYVLGKLWRKHVDDVQDEIIRLMNDNLVEKVYMETNADKGYLAKQIRTKGVLSSPYHEGMNKYYKITSYLKSEWQNVIFVKGTDLDYINQIVEFNEHAEHDDAPDSLASLIRLLWKRSGEEYKSVFG